MQTFAKVLVGSGPVPIILANKTYAGTIEIVEKHDLVMALRYAHCASAQVCENRDRAGQGHSAVLSGFVETLLPGHGANVVLASTMLHGGASES